MDPGSEMAWIEVHQSLATHRKTFAMASKLGIVPVHVVGHLVVFWLWAIDNAPDGCLSGIEDKTIAQAAHWAGDPTEFAEALEAASFLERDPDGSFVIHDWHDYAGKLLDRRAANAARMRLERSQQVLRTPNPSWPLSAAPECSDGAEDTTKSEASAIFALYKAKVQPKAVTYDYEAIRRRIKTFGLEAIKQAIEHFSQDYWHMENNAPRGAKWFFASDQRIEGYINMLPRARPTDTASRGNGFEPFAEQVPKRPRAKAI